MTPREKAKELYCKYTDALDVRDLQITANPFAKECALICCNEILVNISADIDYIYWLEIKQEVEKL